MANKKVLYALCGLALGALLGVSGNSWALLVAPALIAIGFYLPEVLVYNDAIKRTQEIEWALADSVDLLSMCVESGLGLEAAFGKVSDVQSGPMSEEFAAEQCREMRSARRGKAREQAQKVPVKILLPVMLCFLPGIFLIILGPAVISIFSSSLFNS